MFAALVLTLTTKRILINQKMTSKRKRKRKTSLSTREQGERTPVGIKQFCGDHLSFKNKKMEMKP